MILGIILAILIISFGVVLLFGAPYLPTLRPQIEIALQMADLKPGDTLIELGSGDGRVMLAAAKQGINVVGYELNPVLAAISWLRTLMYKKHTSIIWGDFWQKDWPEHQAIFTFLLPKYMPKLDKKVMQSKHKPVKLVSFAFEVPGKRPAAQKHGVFLYVYR
jgi:hypothetical protein